MTKTSRCFRSSRQPMISFRTFHAQYSYNLFPNFYGSAFGLVAFFRRLDLMPRNSIRETVRLDTLKARAKELARQIKQAEDMRTSHESTRSISKPKFRS